MANEQLPEKIEDAIVGVTEFVVRLCRTFLVLVVKPRQLLAAVRDGFEGKQLLYPRAFLISCAIALGFLGTILAEGIGNIGVDVVDRVRDLTLVSFLNHSVPVFGIAIIAAVAVDWILPGGEPDRRRDCKDLNYYVIGFFGIGGLLLLLLLSGLLSVAFDNFGSHTQWWKIVSGVAVISYVIAVYGLIYWLTSSAFRGSSAPALSWGLSARIFLVNGIVIALCVGNFVSPVYEWEEGRSSLKGRMVDLASRPDGTYSVTFLVENVNSTDAAVSRVDDPSIFVELGDDIRVELPGYFGSGCGADGSEPDFLLVAAGQSQILTVCTRDGRMRGLIDDAGYVDSHRERAGRRFDPLGPRMLAFSIALRIFVGDRRDGWHSVALRTAR